MWIAYLSDLKDIAEPVEAVEHLDSSSGLFGVHKDHSAVTFRHTFHGHTDVGSDDLSSLSHEILQVLPRRLQGKLSLGLGDDLGLILLTLPMNKFRLFGLGTC